MGCFLSTLITIVVGMGLFRAFGPPLTEGTIPIPKGLVLSNLVITLSTTFGIGWVTQSKPELAVDPEPVSKVKLQIKRKGSKRKGSKRKGSKTKSSSKNESGKLNVGIIILIIVLALLFIGVIIGLVYCMRK